MKSIKYITKKYAGFSLMQVLITLALGTLLAGMTIPLFTFFDRAATRAEFDRLYQLCLLLQQRAYVQQREYRLQFDPEKQEYRTYAGSATDGNFLAHNSYYFSTYLKLGIKQGVKGPPAEPTKALRAVSTFPDNTIIFYPSGVIQPGSVYFVDPSLSVVYALTVSVNAISYVRRYLYSSETQAWQLFE